MTTLSIDEHTMSKNRLSVIKFMELVSFHHFLFAKIEFSKSFLVFSLKSLSVACCVLHYYSFDDNELVTAFVATGTFTGFIVVLIAIFASEFLK